MIQIPEFVLLVLGSIFLAGCVECRRYTACVVHMHTHWLAGCFNLVTHTHENILLTTKVRKTRTSERVKLA